MSAACASILGFEDLSGRDAGDAQVIEASTDGPDGGAVDADATCTPAQSFDSDPKNCGRCGHDCLGGECQAGTCLPVVLATGQQGTHWLALDSTEIYWTDGTSVRTCSKTSGAIPTTVLDGRQNITEISASNGRVFWTECETTGSSFGDGGVFKCEGPKCAGGPELVWNKGCAVAVASDIRGVFWGSTVEIFFCPGATACSASPTKLTTDQYGYPSGLTLAGTSVYWLESQEALSRCTSLTCASGVEVVATDEIGTALGALAIGPPSLAGSFAYWTRFSTLSGAQHFAPPDIPKIQNSDGVVFRARRDADGGPGESVVTGGAPTAVIADESAIRFTDFAAGEIRSCPITGCNGGPKVIAAGQNQPFSLVQDESAIYWANYGDGRVMKLAK